MISVEQELTSLVMCSSVTPESRFSLALMNYNNKQICTHRHLQAKKKKVHSARRLCDIRLFTLKLALNRTTFFKGRHCRKLFNLYCSGFGLVCSKHSAGNNNMYKYCKIVSSFLHRLKDLGSWKFKGHFLKIYFTHIVAKNIHFSVSDRLHIFQCSTSQCF